jgi:hypothetical protein
VLCCVVLCFVVLYCVVLYSIVDSSGQCSSVQAVQYSTIRADAAGVCAPARVLARCADDEADLTIRDIPLPQGPPPTTHVPPMFPRYDKCGVCS